MTVYRNKYLEMLKAEIAKNPLGDEVPKVPKPGFVSFGTSQVRPFSEFSAPVDAEGVPCGRCPSCSKGEFWRWPKYRPRYDARCWLCWFCCPPVEDSEQWDFCGVPDEVLTLGRGGNG